MKKTYTSLLLATLMVSTQLIAQVKEFDLSSYETTDYKRSSLDLTFDLNQSIRNSHSEFIYNDDFWNYRRRNFSGLLNMGYGYIDFSRDRIIRHGSSFVFNNQSAFSENSNDSMINSEQHSTQNSRIFGEYLIQKFYGNSQNNSWILGGGLSISGQRQSSANKQDTINNALILNANPIDVSLTIGHAHGRLEDVGVAVKAIYILDDLTKNGLLTRAATEQDIALLADRINELEQERFFDYRLYRKMVMEELVYFFTSHSLVEKETVALYNVISDYHFYAGINNRQSGQELRYTASPGYQMSLYESGQWSYTKHTGNISFSVEYTNTKPISLKWHRTLYARIYNRNSSSSTYYKANEYPSKQERIPENINVSVSYHMAYIPSTRSSYSAYVSTAWNKFLTVDYISNQYSSNFYHNIGFQGNYYLSERVRLNGEFNFYLNDQSDNAVVDGINKNRKSNYFGESLKFSLNYYLF